MRVAWIALAIALLHASAAVAADAADDTTESSRKPLWELGAGLAFAGYPDFRGSDQYNVVGVPIPIVVYRGDWLRLSRGNARARVFESRRFDINVTGDGSLPANSDADNGRAGMPDLDPTFSVGPSFDWTLSDPDNPDQRLRLRLPVRAAFVASFSNFDTLGIVVEPTLVYDRHWRAGASRWGLALKAGPLWASTAYHDYYYTVKPKYARAGRPAYDADGGYSGARASAGLLRRRGRLSLGAYLSFDYLGGARFDDSPLVATRQSWLAGAFVAWRFWQSHTRAPVAQPDDVPYD